MTQKLISIELGDSHYYFISDVVAIRIDEYSSMNQDQKDTICTATSKFGAEIPEFLITRYEGMPDRSFFYGRRKIAPNQKSGYKRSITKLTADIEPFYKKVRHLCELHEINGKAFVSFEPASIDDINVQTFISYIKFTQ